MAGPLTSHRAARPFLLGVDVKLSEALLGLGHAIPYYPRLAELLDSQNAAILLAQLFFWTQYESDDDGWVKKSSTEIGQSTGLGRHKLDAARKRLDEVNVVETHKNGEHATLHYKINWEALEALWAGSPSLPEDATLCRKPANHFADNRQTTTPETGKDTYTKDPTKTHKDVDVSDQDAGNQQSLVTAERPSYKAIATGELDKIPKTRLLSKDKQVEDILGVLLDFWKFVWGNSDPRVMLSQARITAFRSAIREGWKLSDFAKALRGMRFDDWDGRRNHNDWKHVAKQMEKWLRLHDQNASRPLPRAPMPDTDTKLIRGVRVPKDYQWSSADDYCLDNGWTWTGDKWERPTKTM